MFLSPPLTLLRPVTCALLGLAHAAPPPPSLELLLGA